MNTTLAKLPLRVSVAQPGIVNRSKASPATAAAPTTANAPSIKLPLAFILTGLFALFVTVGWLIKRPELLASYHYNQFVVAATHLFILGWLCSVVMGSVYQLVPVALETKLYSERLAYVQWLCHFVGFTGMVWMFYSWNMKQVGHFGSLMALGVGLFVYNIVRTLLRVPKWTVVAGGVSAAIVWLSLTVTAGLCIAAGKCSYGDVDSAPTGGLALVCLRGLGHFMSRFDPIGAMHAHAHLGVVGFFTTLTIGTSYKLIPMFTLSEVQNRKRAALSLMFLNVGLIGTFFSVLLRSRWKFGCAALVVAALGIYAIELRAILRARKRRSLDWGLKMFLTAVALMAPLSVLALVLSWPGLPLTPFTGQLENLYGFLGIGGMVSLAILGMLYKILPFLVWFGTYSKQIGLKQVPTLAELYSEKWQIAGYFLFVAALVLLSIGIPAASATLVRFGAVALGLSLVTFAINVVLMLRHFFHPRLKPMPGAAAPIIPARL